MGSDMELCFNVRTFFYECNVYLFRSFLILTSYTMEETVSRQFILSDKRKSRKVFRLPLSRYWNVPIKDAFCPNRRTLFPNGRMCFQSVDEVSLTKYDEDIIKQ